MSAEQRHAQLVEIHGSLTRGMTQIFETAVEIEEPAGVSAEWQALCQHYGVALISDEERQQVRAAQRPDRGAALMEVSQVVKSLTTWARRAVKKIDCWDDPHEVRSLHERLTRLVDRIDGEFDTMYRNAVLPPRGGMFGNVLAHHDPDKKTTWSKARAFTYKCKTCGAPRMKAGEAICPFCDNPVA